MRVAVLLLCNQLDTCRAALGFWPGVPNFAFSRLDWTVLDCPVAGSTWRLPALRLPP